MTEDSGPYTFAARQVVESAPAHAAALGHRLADPEHLLLGLVTGSGAGMAALVLREVIGVDLADVQRGIEARTGLGDRLDGRPAPLSVRARRALELALAENPVAGPHRIGTDHLLLGVLAEGGIAAEVLGEHGVTAEGLRAARDLARERHYCYGCAERHGGRRFSPRPLPEVLAELVERLTDLSRAKEAAIDAQNWERGAELREAEKDTLRRALSDLDEPAAKARLSTAVEEIVRLRAQVGRLGELLHHGHGIDEPERLGG